MAHPDEPFPDEALLVVERGSYSYLQRFVALDDVSVSIRRGEKVALVGANGCGKSTMLKLLGGLLFPDSGRYTAFGFEVTEDHLEDEQFSRGFRSRVGLVFQNSDAQVFSPTVREEVAFGPLNMVLEREDADRRVVDTLAMLDIADLSDRAPIHDLSVMEELADRCIVFSEDHHVAADGPTAGILGEESLLVSVNLIAARARGPRGQRARMSSAEA